MPKQPSIRSLQILTALINQDRTAVQIVHAVAEATAGRERIPLGSIYTQLHRLERSGMVRGYEKDEDLHDRRGRPRRYYKLKGAGNTLLNDLEAIRGGAHA